MLPHARCIKKRIEAARKDPSIPLRKNASLCATESQKRMNRNTQRHLVLASKRGPATDGHMHAERDDASKIVVAISKNGGT